MSHRMKSLPLNVDAYRAWRWKRSYDMPTVLNKYVNRDVQIYEQWRDGEMAVKQIANQHRISYSSVIRIVRQCRDFASGVYDS